METRAHHVFIGLFIVIAFGCILLFSLWLGQSSAEREVAYYDILFNEEVSGLTPGSAVEYSGLKVGEVASLKLDQQDPRKVWAHIRIAANTPVRQNTQARLALANITGSSLIRLFGGSPDSPPLLSPDNKIPVIIAEPSPMSRFLANGEDLMGNISDLAKNANQMVSDENIRNLSQTLDNMKLVTDVLATHRNDLAETMQQLNATSKQADIIMRDLAHLTNNANNLLNEQGRPALKNASLSMANLERATHRLDQLINNNQIPFENSLRGLSALGPALQELRVTLGSLNRLILHLEENPAGFLLEREIKQEFKP